MRIKPLILVVDDEPDLLEIMSANLTRSGFEAIVAKNAKEAVDAARKLGPDLILMDIHMPGESGTDAALEIKQDPTLKSIKIAFLSNLADPWPKTSAPRDAIAKELGMEEYLDKTADWPTNLEKIKKILGMR
jgi:two-component system, OmpR family, alkaline phosphatase synthesis response regulator PhoP